MPLNASQLAILKTDLNTNPAVSGSGHTPDNADFIANYYNQLAAPTGYWVWRTSVSEQEITRATSTDGTNWSWTTYIGRSQGERDAWPRLFAGNLGCNPSLANVRNAFADIFSAGGASGLAQRTHISTICRRLATRCEKLMASGVGTSGSPSTMGFEGTITYPEVQAAWNLP